MAVLAVLARIEQQPTQQPAAAFYVLSAGPCVAVSLCVLMCAVVLCANSAVVCRRSSVQCPEVLDWVSRVFVPWKRIHGELETGGTPHRYHRCFNSAIYFAFFFLLFCS